MIAPPSQSAQLLPADQIVRGDARRAEARVRAGGWLVLSRGLANEEHLHVGEAFRLPSPDPTIFRVAALSTNIGWAPGAIVMNAGDYARAWGSEDASAYGILLARNILTRPRVSREIERATGTARSGLTAQTAGRHAAQQRALDRGALARLTQIARLIPIFAVLAMAAAIGAMVWQRRPRLAKLKLEGLARAELWRTILFESLLLLGAGCASGAIFGLYGQQLADRALANVIDFPVVHSVAPLTTLGSLLARDGDRAGDRRDTRLLRRVGARGARVAGWRGRATSCVPPRRVCSALPCSRCSSSSSRAKLVDHRPAKYTLS